MENVVIMGESPSFRDLMARQAGVEAPCRNQRLIGLDIHTWKLDKRFGGATLRNIHISGFTNTVCRRTYGVYVDRLVSIGRFREFRTCAHLFHSLSEFEARAVRNVQLFREHRSRRRSRNVCVLRRRGTGNHFCILCRQRRKPQRRTVRRLGPFGSDWLGPSADALFRCIRVHADSRRVLLLLSRCVPAKLPLYAGCS